MEGESRGRGVRQWEKRGRDSERIEKGETVRGDIEDERETVRGERQKKVR